jgi:hypothetical protein
LQNGKPIPNNKTEIVVELILAEDMPSKTGQRLYGNLGLTSVHLARGFLAAK